MAELSLTRVAAMTIMIAGVIELLRRITTCLLLVALAGIYASPLAAAFAPTGMDCCAAGMCPLAGHSHSRHQAGGQNQSHQQMPNCAMGTEQGSTRECQMGACGDQREDVVRVAVFVLSAPAQIIQSPVQESVSPRAFEPEHLVSQIPDTPPPRTVLS